MGHTVRLMTSNLLRGRADADGLRRVIEEFHPDVVVTQELGYEYVDLLQTLYRHHYLHPDDDFIGRGIATNFEVTFGDITMPVRLGTSAVLQVKDEIWNVAGVHLLNPIQFPWWASVRGRTAQLAAIDDWSSGVEEPVLVVGDFNASPRWPAYKHMAARWADLVAEYHQERGAKPDRTWGWRPGWPRMLRIDHVFGAGVMATRVNVVPIHGTDHHAVLVDLARG